MDKVKQASTLMAMKAKMGTDPKGKPINEKRHRGMIRSLLYLTTIWPNFIPSVCLYARF